MSAQKDTNGRPQNGKGMPPPEVLANIPIFARVDMFFTPQAAIEFSIFGVFLIYFVPPLIYYILHRENALIKYRQPKMVIIGGIICSIHALSLPVNIFMNFFKIIKMV